MKSLLAELNMRYFNSANGCLIIKYPDAKNLIVKSKNGDTVAKKVIDNDKISFITTAGAVYEICR